MNIRQKLLASLLLLVSVERTEAVTASVKAMGMGGATAAFAQDSISIVYNPANAAQLEDRWDAGVTFKYWQKELEYINTPFIQPEGKYSAKNDYFFFPELGFNTWLNCEWAFGLTLNTHDYIDTRFSNAFFVSGENQKHLRMQYAIEELTGTLAWRFHPCHSIGIGLNFYAGRFCVNGLGGIEQNIPPISINDSRSSDMGYDYTTGLGVTFGWYGNLWDGFALAATFSPEVTMERFNRYLGFLSEARLNIPMTWSIGAAYTFACEYEWTVALDFESRHYRQIHSWGNPFPVPPTLTENRFGAEDGPGFSWRNQYLIKTGVDCRLNDCWTVRAGYRYERTPMRANRADTFLNMLTLETVKNYLSAGATWDIACDSQLSVFGEWGLHNKVKGLVPDFGQGPDNIQKWSKWSYSLGLAYGQCF